MPRDPAAIARLETWQATGRLAVRTAQDGFSAHFDWRQVPGDGELSVRGPFGAGAARISIAADRIRIELTPRPGSGMSATEMAGEFTNELINQALRFKLAKQTEKVRTMIVGRAIGEAQPYDSMSDQQRDGGPDRGPDGGPDTYQIPDLPPEVAKLLAEEDDGLDFLDDPLGIAVPWEEKYGKKKDGENKADKEPEGT